MAYDGDLRGYDERVARVSGEDEVVVEEVDLLEAPLQRIAVEDARNEVLETGIDDEPALLVTDLCHLREAPLREFLEVTEIH